jgi:hypothetical protein
MMTAREFSRMRGLRFATAARQVRMRRELEKQAQLTRLGEVLTGKQWDK